MKIAGKGMVIGMYIDKVASGYDNYFADKTGKNSNNQIRELFGPDEQSYSSENISFFSYDKNFRLTDGESASKQNGNQAQEKSNIKDFLNNAADILKNLVTDQDYSPLAELGVIAEKDSPDTIVTVYERIQIQLAAYGDVDVSSLNISSSKIEKVLNSKALANQVKKAESIGDIDDNGKAYLLKNNLEPTVDNVYKAVHLKEGNQNTSSGEALTDQEWQQLKPQVEKFLEKNGLEINETHMESARWLVNNNIDLNSKNIINYEKLVEIEDKDTRDMESVKANMVMASVFGMKASKGYMTAGWIEVNKVREAVDIVEKADPATAEYIISRDLVLNVANLKKYSGEGTPNIESDRANRILFEAKAVMTMEGAILMEKLGVDITYTSLEEITVGIKEENSKYIASFLDVKTSENITILSEVMDVVKEMPALPVASVGAVVKNQEPFHISAIHKSGTQLRQVYDRAEEVYEAVGTKVRGDLGDNIKKAFVNIDSIIEDTGLQVNDENRRAVRILGYNSMEITRDSIAEISQKVTEVDSAIKNITPRTAAYLIENGINPLNEDIEKLNEKLQEINREIGADETEEYSKYLWKLEKSGNITNEQRQAYIQLYRDIKTIERADTRAIGAVVQEGAALTMANLLTAEKSRGKYGMDVSIDKDTGYYEGKLIKNKLSDILDNMTAGVLETVEDATVEQLDRGILSPENLENSQNLNMEYYKETAKNTLSQIQYSEEVLYNIMDGGMDTTLSNMAAVSQLIQGGSEVRQILKDRLNGGKRLEDGFTDEAEAEKAYDELKAAAGQLFNQVLNNGDVDYLRYRSLNNAAVYMARSAKNKSYNIPVDIEGEEILVKVKFSHSMDGENPKIKITFNSESMGKVETRLSVGNGEIAGMIVCSRQETCHYINENIEVLTDKLDMEDSIAVETGDFITIGGRTQSEKAEGHTDKELYEIAKTFLGAIKDWSKMPIK